MVKKWQTVVVGVDGSEGSHRALTWAADEARDHEAALTVVATWAVPAVPPPAGYAAYPWTSELDLAAVAQQQLEQDVAAVLGAEPGLAVQLRVLEGHAASQLIDAAADADLLVVGSRGHGGFAGMLLGSVSQHVAAHARCPVVVIR